MAATMTHDQVLEALDDLPGWVAVDDALHARYDPPDVPTAGRLLTAVLEVAEEQNHHPDVDLRWRRLRFRLSSHDVGGLTERDVALATEITRLAAEHDAEAMDPTPTVVDIGIDTADPGALVPFWAAALDGEASGGESVTDGAVDVVDPEGAGPTIWFQRTDTPAEGRNRLHLDVWVPTAEVAAERGAAIEAAGGRLLTDEYAPAFRGYADPQGNEVCICTPLGRD